MSTIGKRIARQRKKMRLTQNALAEILMVSNKAISKWESDLGNPSFEFLPRLCEVLDCSADYLILGVNTFEHYKKIRAGVLVKLGKDSDGKEYYEDITQFPHLLTIGQTGSGKSCLFHSFIMDIINTYSPEDVKLGLIDPKEVEFVNIYKNLPHLIQPVACTSDAITNLLENITDEMTRRYKTFQELNVRNIFEYNKTNNGKLPFNIIIIDELADVILNEKAKELILNLYRYGRASGTHLIIGTQRLRRDTLPMDWTNFFPARICFKVHLKEQSEEYFSISGGEKLKGFGELLFYKESNDKLLKMQAPYYSIEQIFNILKEKGWHNESIDLNDDTLLQQLSKLFKDNNIDEELELGDQLLTLTKKD